LPIENTQERIDFVLASLNPSTIESMTVLKDLPTQFTVRVRLMVLLSLQQKREETLVVDYNFQYGSGELVKL
jgi:iron complex outermembrane receptor protein